MDVHQIAELERTGIKRTNDDSKFLPGDILSRVELIFDGKDFLRSTENISENKPIGIILDKTNFYAEQGGQVCDHGKILIDGIAEFRVLDVQVHGDYIVHNGFLYEGVLRAGDEVICEYDETRRRPIRNNHTGTHILNHALREHLGDEINQKGSLVDQDKLRFDFSHKTSVTNSELQKIENSSNKYIRQNCKIYTKEVDLDTAKGIEGVRAVFGETYPNPVRVVSVGVEVDTLLENPTNPEWRNISVEFCGGTHVDQTGLIKDLVIVEESGIAKGIRRIVAFTGDSAEEVQRLAMEFSKRLEDLEKMPYGPSKETIVKETQQELNKLTISTLTKEQLKNRFAKIQKDILDEQKKKQKAESKIALDTVIEYFAQSENENSKFYIGKPQISANPRAIADVMNHFKSKAKDKSIYLFGGSPAEGTVVHGVYIGTDLSTKGVTAASCADVVSSILGGRHGGKEPTRTGQGTRPERIDEAVTAVRELLASKLEI